MTRPTSASRANSARVLARKLALQCLYGWQLNPGPWQDLMLDFDRAEEAPRADREFFQSLVRGVCEQTATLDAQLAQWCDRTPAELDPVEHAALLIGLHELTSHPEVPFRVVISEAVGLARRFGATDGHKFVNAIMDKAARSLRPHEH
ncbi:MAG: transcription antitermination factor NusB [Proteobacteria bacterium]|jgi:N utilization substance protein B|nr:transcription antitermination factor NusB [Pseudomonadota bacterium]MBK7114806.1 transcription antitermination factor NusB [Pseudomonadota bacterium]MBK9251859.1 transcription antitermination factor NusB [Pseudomonadota bacterium]MCC6631493.1 transcription antitermination factor NusB [Gammaproteobacteria bacterium]